jgi:FkbM family methyltransferase
VFKTFCRKTSSLIKHLYKGTAGDRTKAVFAQWRHENFWVDYPRWGSSFVHPISERVNLRLYRDDRLSELIYKKDFEENERSFVCQYLKPGMGFFDVGANIGLYSLIAAQIVGPTGFVYALEPVLKTYARLQGNIRLNGFTNIRTKRVALSDVDEFRDMVTYVRRYNAWNSLGGQTINTQPVLKERVQCIQLDYLIENSDIQGQINLAKIDVEGWELHVIKGGKNFFQSTNAPDVLIEFTDLNMELTGTSAQEVYKLLQSYGYQLFRIDSDKKLLLSEMFGKNHPYENYFASKNLSRCLNLTGYTHVNL